MFCAETSAGCDKIASTLGPEACLYYSQDDKSSVYIGKVAAKVQTPILMNMRYRVRLPDHDFCVGSRHLLVPSVMAQCVINPSSGVTYTGHTYIAVRSSKHNNSTAFSHQEDFGRFKDLNPEVFDVPGSPSVVKPVVIKVVDGGPDENPRFENNKVMACKTCLENNLDCLIELTQAPGHSAFNRAERRMFHLSKEMSGLVLPHDTFGSHLQNGKTIDEDLEGNNFAAAGEVLSEVWNRLVIDGYEVKAEYITQSVDEKTKTFAVSPAFRSRHILETQYMTIILKCDDRQCCSAMRTNVDMFFPDRRVPALIPVKFSPSGPVALSPSPDIHTQTLRFLDIFGRIVMEKKLVPDNLKLKYGDKVPYDVYMPSQLEMVERRVFSVCGMYFSSLKSLTQQHRKVCKKPRKTALKVNRVLIEDSDSDDEEELALNASFNDDENDQDGENIEEVILEPVSVGVASEGGFEVILDLKQWLKGPWNLANDD